MNEQPERCGALAIDINTRERFQCQLVKGHPDTVAHRWGRMEGDHFRRVVWYGDGYYVGTRIPPPSTPQRGLLTEDTEEIRLIPQAVRDMWTKPPGWRCQHADGRGQCTSRETRHWWNATKKRPEFYCEKHYPAAEEQGA